MRKSEHINPPIIPRCLCRSTLHWLLQIGSPSLFFSNRSKAAERYFEKRRIYEIKVIERKIRARTCTRSEWTRYRYELFKKKE